MFCSLSFGKWDHSMQGNPRQSITVDSTLWIQDSRYWSPNPCQWNLGWNVKFDVSPRPSCVPPQRVGVFAALVWKREYTSLLLRRFVFLMAEASVKREWLVMNLKGPWEGYRRFLLPAFLCAYIFIERETSGYEAGNILCSFWSGIAYGFQRNYRSVRTYLLFHSPNE